MLNKLSRLGDESLDSGKASRYTERVNTILQAILTYSTFHAYCMQVGVAGEAESKRVQGNRFIYSQAIKTLVFLEDAFNCEYLPPEAQYLDLIERSKKILVWKGLIRYVHVGEHVLKLKQSMPEGTKRQLDVSILFAAQTYFNSQAGLTLPIAVEPLDELVEFPEHILQEALRAAKEKIEDPEKFHPELYTLPFWRAYIREGYKHDFTVKGTELEDICRRIGEALKKDPAEGKWCKTYPNISPLEAREKTVFLAFVYARDQTMERKSVE